MKLKLAAPDPQMESAYLDFAMEWKKSGEQITPYSARLLGRSYGQWLSDTRKMEKTAPDGFVTGTTYFLTDESGKILGAVNIRHRLNGPLLATGGHIGYGIRPSERKKGYANLMLGLALTAAKELGITKALVTCDKANAASAKTILHNGGRLENEVPDGGRITQRYWIEIP